MTASLQNKTRSEYIFTSESVSEGHPDKVCDQISDSILDAYISKAPEARCAVETLATTNMVVIAGEVRAPEISKAELEGIVRNTVKEIGYEQEGFNWKNLNVINLIHEQSKDIAMGVDSGQGKDEGAGDQGLMFGYACDETEVFMPAAIYYSHQILKSLSDARHKGELPDLMPDAKSQVTILYKDGKPVKAHSVLVSTQHTENVGQAEIREMVRKHVLKVLPDGWMADEKNFLINPTGKFVIGGPDGDTGLTGRKIIVDTYGGSAPHGGGAFSGKDPTKVDRSAAYVARYLAKNVVAAKLAKRCTIQVAYAIGVTDPVSFYVNTHGTGIVDEPKLEKVLRDLVPLSPRGIRQHLKLNNPIYKISAAYGHFGRNPTKEGHFTWERLDLVDELRKLV